MHLGIGSNLVNILAMFQAYRFEFLKFCFGFDHALTYLRRLGKNSQMLVLVRNGAQIGKRCDIETHLFFHNCKNFKNLSVGDDCHIGKACFFDLAEKITIMNNCTISMECLLVTHLDVGKSDLQRLYYKRSAGILIGAHSYLGARTTVLPGVAIGTQSMVAASSVVTASVKDGILVAGIPAKRIKDLEIGETVDYSNNS